MSKIIQLFVINIILIFFKSVYLLNLQSIRYINTILSVTYNYNNSFYFYILMLFFIYISGYEFVFIFLLIYLMC